MSQTFFVSHDRHNFEEYCLILLECSLIWVYLLFWCDFKLLGRIQQM